jgi:C-terminal processing protease CtpA/Prc
MGQRHHTVRAAVGRSLFFLMIFCCGWGTARNLPPERFGFGSRADRETAVIREAWHLIDRHYVDHRKIDPDRLKQAALSAMLTSLGDRGHTSYITADQFDQMVKTVRSQTDGTTSYSTSIAWAPVPGQPIAHLVIRGFGLAADTQLKQALQDIRRRGLRGIILDLRGCPGGWREQAIAVVSEFVANGNVILERDVDSRLTAVPVRPNGLATDIPLCVLVDGDTASCAEILAGALQDYQRGPLIGTRTFGAGTLVQPFPLSDGSAVMLAVAEWRTPKGRCVWHKGLTPDITVDLAPGVHQLTVDDMSHMTASTLEHSEDAQFLTGLHALQEQLHLSTGKHLSTALISSPTAP